MNVATLGIRELRAGLSRHLDRVREGLEITVTDHGRPIARITPLHSSGIEQLLQEGVARRPSGPRLPLPEPVSAEGTVSDLISDQRR